MASTIQKAACNRQPFVSEDGCDRGSVDIHQFDDLPFCDRASPTLPKVPPEIVDTPIMLPIPSPCACFNINHSFKFKYNKQRQFKATASFAARGDCCEGNYDAKFDLQVPCPIISEGSIKKITARFRLGKKGESVSASATYIDINRGSCTIKPQDVRFDIQLPCPIHGGNYPKKMTMKIGYGDSGASTSKPYVKASPDRCTIEPQDVNFELKIPCPISNEDNENKIKATIAWGSGATSVSDKYYSADRDGCKLEMLSPTLNLKIPCPIYGGDDSVGYENSGTGSSTRKARIVGYVRFKAKPNYVNKLCYVLKGATMYPYGPEFNENQVYAVSKTIVKRIGPIDSGPFTHDALSIIARVVSEFTVPMGYSGYIPKRGQLMIQFHPTIYLETASVTSDFELEYIEDEGNAGAGISAKVEYGDGDTAHADVVEADHSACTIRPLAANLNLTVPCPIGILYWANVKLRRKARIPSGTLFTTINFYPLATREGRGHTSYTFYTVEAFDPGDKYSPEEYYLIPIRPSDEIDADILDKLNGEVLKTGNEDVSSAILSLDKSDGVYLKLGVKYLKIGSGSSSSSSSFSSGSSGPVKLLEINRETCSIIPRSRDIILTLPCPIRDDNYPKKMTMKIGYGDSGASTSLSYVKASLDSCTIEPQDVNFELKIPCPITDIYKPKIKAKVTYGRDTEQKSAEFLEQNKDSCTIKGKDVSLDLQIKCPIIGNAGNKKIKASIKYGSGSTSASATYLKTDTEACAIEVPDDVALSLNLPCPINGEKKKPKITAQVTYGTDTGKKIAEFLEQNKDSCTIKGKDVSLDLQIKCPIIGNAGNKKIKASIKYGSGSTSASATYLKTDTGCAIEVPDDVALNLNLPCPIKGNAGIKKIKASIKYGSGSTSASATYLKTNTGCAIEVPDDVALNLQIPCPISKDKLSFEASFTNTDDATGSFSIIQDEESGCSRSIKFKVKFPGAAKVNATVLHSIRYYDHKLQVKFINLKTGEEDASWTDVFTAVPHTGSC